MKTLELIEPLTPAETTELQRLEFVIKSAQKHVDRWVDAVRALRDGRLYRAEFSTFANYCEAKLKLQIRAVQMALKLEDVRADAIKLIAPSDQQTRAIAEGASANTLRNLAVVPAKARAAVLRTAAAETGGKPTGAAVKRAAARLAHEPLPKTGMRNYSDPKPVDASNWTSSAPKQEPQSSTRRVPVENIGGKIAGALPPVTDAKSAGDRLRAEYETFKPWFNSVPLPPPRDVLEKYLACLEATQ